MEWEVSPQEYRYILGDFVRSGISIKYAKTEILGEPRMINISGLKEFTDYPDCRKIFYPYISARQYYVYKEYHIVTSEDDSYNYQILDEPEGECIDFDIECLRNWDFFCESFNVNLENKTIFQHKINGYCYAFIFDYEVRFLDIPTNSYDVIDKDLLEDDDLEEFGINSSNYALPKSDNTNIQTDHIFEIYKNYTLQKTFYPIYMSLEWFYLVRGQRLGIDTILRSIAVGLPYNMIYQDELMTNYVIDSFPYMSEKEIIKVFEIIRDNYAGKDKTKRNEWYVHTAALMDEILKDKRAKNIARKIKIVRSFCNNQGVASQQLSENNKPYLKNVSRMYKKKVDVIYEILLEDGYISEETVLSDFKYYLTGVEESDIKGTIHWIKQDVDLVGFILCICNEDDKVEWSTVTKIFYNDNKGEAFKSDSLKTAKNRFPTKQIERFEKLFE